jgi:hypothetical protein
LAAVGLTLGEGDAVTDGVVVGEGTAEVDGEGELVFTAVGVEPVHADAISAVTASDAIQSALFMSCSGNGPAGD